MSEHKVALITGASRGIGQAIARLLAQHGFTVVGTSRDPSRVQSQPEWQLVAMDVRSDDSVTAAVERIRKAIGPIDVLVNSAGYLLGGPIETTSIQQAHAQFETNFFGTVRVTQAVLPEMRARRAGRILNVSSIVGRVPLPFQGFYAASKHALEGYTEALRHEVLPFGIAVSLIEPGIMRTELWDGAASAARSNSDYHHWTEPMDRSIRRHVGEGSDPAVVARVVLHVLTRERPRLRYTAGRDAALLSRLQRLLPARALEAVVRREFGLQEVAG